MMKAGKLRHRVTIQNCIESDDGSGGRSTDWFDDGQIRVALRQATSLEIFNAGRQNNVVTHMVEARYTEKLTEKSRLRFEKRGKVRIFNVVSVDDVMEVRRKLMIQVKEAR